MNRMILFSGLLMLGLLPLKAVERIVERPAFSAWAQNSLEIDKIVMNDTETVFFIDGHYHPNQWIRIDKTSYIKAGNTKYYIKALREAELDSFIWMPQSGTRSFQMIFPPLPANTKEVDFIEGDNVERAFKIWGIRLDGKRLEVKDREIPQTPSLLTPAQFVDGTAVLTGKLWGYTSGMGLKGTINYVDILTSTPQDIPVEISPDGTFKANVKLKSPVNTYLNIGSITLPIMLAPGKDASVDINMPELFRLQSRLHADEPSLGFKCVFGGEMAGINNERANLQLPAFSIRPNSQESFNEQAKTLATASFDQIEAYFDKRYNQTLQQVDTLKEVSQTNKQLIVMDLKMQVLLELLNCTQKGYIEYLYRAANNIPRDSALTNFQFVQPTPNYTALFDKYLPNDPALLYIPYLAFYIDVLTYTNYLNRPAPSTPQEQEQYTAQGYYKDDFFKVAGIENGFLKELLNARVLARNLTDFQPLTDSQQKAAQQLPPALCNALFAMNEELKQTIEENKKKSGYTVNRTNITDIPNDELFNAILTPYRGKVVFVDFWATWCGPCVSAMKQTEPVKEEYKDKGVVFLYLAGENSPKGTWEQKITDIKGEHYRMSNAQWEFMYKKFKIQGVPTYMIVGKDGTIVRTHTAFMGVENMKKWIDDELKK